MADDTYPDFNVDLIGQNIDLVHELTGRRIGRALHGSSGLSEKELAAAARAGVVKVNWSSESLLIRSQAARDFYLAHTGTLASPKNAGWKTTAMDHGLQSYVAEKYLLKVTSRMRLLGAAGHGRAFLAAQELVGLRTKTKEQRETTMQGTGQWRTLRRDTFLVARDSNYFTQRTPARIRPSRLGTVPRREPLASPAGRRSLGHASLALRSRLVRLLAQGGPRPAAHRRTGAGHGLAARHCPDRALARR